MREDGASYPVYIWTITLVVLHRLDATEYRSTAHQQHFLYTPPMRLYEGHFRDSDIRYRGGKRVVLCIAVYVSECALLSAM